MGRASAGWVALGLLAGGMAPVFFGIKRTHLSVLGISRRFTLEHGLTPARFDMMRIVDLHRFGVGQSRIQDLLGVSAATVSRMLKALEELGFVVRERMLHDRRQRRVHITERGRYCVDKACDGLVRRGGADLLARLGFASDGPVMVATLESYLWSMRKRYGDKAPFEHPWTLQEIVPLIPPDPEAWRPTQAYGSDRTEYLLQLAISTGADSARTSVAPTCTRA